MNEKTEIPVFPKMKYEELDDGNVGHYTIGGMSMRDYFAAKALQGMLANSNTTGRDALDVVEASWAFADKMIELRDKP
jgi:hypothetical protein